ncbi:hypothetical protein HanIR_Chr03g0133641 [Helianthus annuus]|nr:hypothetical protein HanIR_Chr03g0133641 [Helianthus annuus]
MDLHELQDVQTIKIKYGSRAYSIKYHKMELKRCELSSWLHQHQKRYHAGDYAVQTSHR